MKQDVCIHNAGKNARARQIRRMDQSKGVTTWDIFVALPAQVLVKKI
jgi:hypothetical protein